MAQASHSSAGGEFHRVARGRLRLAKLEKWPTEGCALIPVSAEPDWEHGEGQMMFRVVGIDHISLCVDDFKRSKRFYSGLFDFLGFDVMDESSAEIGWSNGKTRYWIRQANVAGRKNKHRTGDIGLHHYAFQLRSRKDVDDLEAYLKRAGATIVDPAGEYYDDYYAVFFLDPDGIKLEGMKYGEKQERARKEARKRAKSRVKVRKQG
jgi:catechol 2,3-dioxygenase-like lactoylglutathione lyase family enzyme